MSMSTMAISKDLFVPLADASDSAAVRGHMKFIAWMFPLLCLGCASGGPKDLRLEATQVVRLSAVPDAWTAAQRNKTLEKDDIKLLKVSFTSKLDIVEFAKLHTVHISYEARSCKSETETGAVVFGIPYVRVGDRSLETAVYFALPNLEKFRAEDGRITYNVLVPLASEALAPFTPNMSGADRKTLPFFDPGSRQSGLCIGLTGGGMWMGSSFKSNLVVVPEGNILEKV